MKNSERKSDDRDPLEFDDYSQPLNQEATTFASPSPPPINQQATTSTSPSPVPAVPLNQEATSSGSFSAVPLDRLKRNIGKRKQGMIVDEFDARCKRVLNQIDLDSNAQTYLLKKLNHETQLAKVLTDKAEIEKEMAEDKRSFEKKKQEMELKFLEAKYKIDLDNLKK
uniref:Uncharacterized protein n=1 Tax=Cacopsylla melanoneura TaxID=428564 RepID=A0A8D8QFY5_9HEMI